MNIFATNFEPSVCAKEHCLVHRRKMLTEYAQIMCMCHSIWGSHTNVMYKDNKAHLKHPSTLWAAESLDNYLWLNRLWKHLAFLHYDSTGREHKSFVSLHEALNMDHFGKIYPSFKTSMLATGENISYRERCRGNIFFAYQLYLSDKFDSWRTRTDKRVMIPEWDDNKVPQWYISNTKLRENIYDLY